MLKSIEGIYRNGKIELKEEPINITEEVPVIVTFLESGNINLPDRGINKKKAAELRARLATFAKDWESPEMDIYNNYDEAKKSYKL